ncbi:MAG: ABC transporter permease [Clostridiales bacterium]|nr:ABC transporter permease [Clostridiales bacterium]
MFLLGVLIMFVISTSWHVKKEESKDSYISIGVVDHDNSEYSKLMISYFEDSDIFTEYATVITGNEEEITNMFYEGKLTVFLVIPENFAENLINIQNVPMKAFINSEDKTRAIILKNMLNAYERYISAVEINCVSLYDLMKETGMSSELCRKVNVDISMDLVFTALGKTDFFEFCEMENVKQVPIETYYCFEILFLFLSYLAMLAGMDLLKERRQGVLVRLISCGTRITTIVLQKMLFYVSMIAVLLALLSGIALSQGGKISVGLIAFLLFYFAIASLFFMLISSFITKIPTFLLISNIMILFGAVLGGGLIPILYLPPSMKEIAMSMVNYWFLNFSTSLYSGEQKFTLTFLLFLCFTILCFTIACSVMIKRKEGMQREDV